MNVLNKIWPWKRFEAYEIEIKQLKASLKAEESRHQSVKEELDKRHQHIRKMANIIALKGGITILMLSCLTCFGQSWIRNNLDTNSVGSAPADGWFLLSTNSIPKWGINGRAFTNLDLSLATNESTRISNNATNEALLIGLGATNEALLIGLGATNEALLIGSNGTNESTRISNNATNEALLIGDSATNEVARAAHGTQLLWNGVNAQSVATGATNLYFVCGTAGGASTFNVTPVGIDGNIIEFRAFYSGTINPTTNVNFEIFTNDFTGNVAAKTTGFQASVAPGTHSKASTNSIPIKSGYGWVVGVWSSQGNGLASSQYSWSIRVQW